MLPSAINKVTKNTHPQKQHNFRIISWQLFLCMQCVWSVIWLYTVNYLLYFTQELYFTIPLFCIKIDFSYYVIMAKTAWKLLVLNRKILNLQELHLVVLADYNSFHLVRNLITLKHVWSIHTLRDTHRAVC